MLALCTNLFYDGVIEVTQVMRGSLNRTLQITQGAKKDANYCEGQFRLKHLF